MSIFTKPTPEQRPSTRLDVATSDTSMSVISHGMRVLGDIESTGVIKIDGVIDGAVRGARQLLLGKTGTINGDIFAVDAVLGGRVVGTVVASERVEIQGTSNVEGDIHTKSIVVYEGGVINGMVRMGDSVPGASAPSPVLSESRVHAYDERD